MLRLQMKTLSISLLINHCWEEQYFPIEREKKILHVGEKKLKLVYQWVGVCLIPLLFYRLRKGWSIDLSKYKWWKVRETDARQFNVSLLRNLEKKGLTVVMYIRGFITRIFTPGTHLSNLKFTNANSALCLVTHESW